MNTAKDSDQEVPSTKAKGEQFQNCPLLLLEAVFNLSSSWYHRRHIEKIPLNLIIFVDGLDRQVMQVLAEYQSSHSKVVEDQFQIDYHQDRPHQHPHSNIVVA